MQEIQQETNFENHSSDPSNPASQFPQKRKSVQTPFEDAIFLEDKAFSEFNEDYSPESTEDLADLEKKRKMTEIIDQVDKVSRKNIIKRVLDFSSDAKAGQEVSIAHFPTPGAAPLCLFTG